MSDNDSRTMNDVELINIDDILSREFQMSHITDRDMKVTVWMTIRALRPKLDASDMATARLALEVAERIDADGPGCAVSLYNRLHSLLLDLQGRGYRAQCPLASQQGQQATE